MTLKAMGCVAILQRIGNFAQKQHKKLRNTSFLSYLSPFWGAKISPIERKPCEPVESRMVVAGQFHFRVERLVLYFLPIRQQNHGEGGWSGVERGHYLLPYIKVTLKYVKVREHQ
jgi:hypothetical protein